MTVPRGWPLAATGRERERTDNADGTTTHRYYQEDVHDFAWTTSPDYVERRERFEHPGPSSCGHASDAAAGTRSQAARHFDGTRAALRHYGEWFGAYPYGHITIVDPVWRSETDGMEYPTLFTAGTSWLMPRKDTYLEDIAVHEAGHQWWYGIVGTNEFEDAWMDEGINQYANARVMAEEFPDGRASAAVLRRVRALGARRRAVGSRHIRRVHRRLSRQPDRRRAGDAIISVLAAYLRPDDVREAIVVAAYPRAGARLDDSAADPRDVLRAVEVQAPAARRFVSDRQRSEPPRSDALLRSGLSRLGGVRLRRRERLERGDRRRIVSQRRRRAATRRRDIPGHDAGHARRRRAAALRMGWRRTVAPRHGSSMRAARCRRRSIPIRCCCSTRASRTTASPPSRRAGRAATKWAAKWMVWLQDQLLTWAFFV